MKLQILQGTYQLVKLPEGSAIPQEVLAQEFYTVSKTHDELSIIVSDSVVIESNYIETWRIIKFVENMDLSLIGITSKISTVLANENINACYVATYNTDYVLVKNDKLEKAITVLEKAGYEFII